MRSPWGILSRVIWADLHLRKITSVAVWEKAWKKEVEKGEETSKESNITHSGKRSWSLEITVVVGWSDGFKTYFGYTTDIAQW